MEKPPPLPVLPQPPASQQVQQQVPQSIRPSEQKPISCASCHKKFRGNTLPNDLDGQYYCFKCFMGIKQGKIQPVSKYLPPSGDQEHCPYCGRIKKIGSPICDGCGIEFPQAEILREPQNPPSMPGSPPQAPVNPSLPNIRVDIVMSAGEQCVYRCNAEYLIDKKGSLFSIFNGDADNLKHQAFGEFYITNKRIVFIAKKKSIYLPLERIVHTNVYMTGIEFVINGMKNPIFCLDSNVEVAVDRIEMCIRERI